MVQSAMSVASATKLLCMVMKFALSLSQKEADILDACLTSFINHSDEQVSYLDRRVLPEQVSFTWTGESYLNS